MRLILGAVILIAAIPIPVTAALRSETEHNIRQAEGSINGLDMLMYLSTSISSLQDAAASYARDPVQFNRDRLEESVRSLHTINDGIPNRSRAEQRSLASVVAVLEREATDLQRSVSRGRSDAGQRRFVLEAKRQGTLVSELAIDRARDGQRSQKHIRSSVRRRLLVVHVLLSVAAALLALAAWILPSRLTQRLSRLEAATQELAVGRVRGRVQVHGEDELGRLARSFDAMAMALSLRDCENKRLLAEQIDRTTRDSLTGLRNNRYFHTTLATLLSTQRTPTSVAMLDLDDFKLVNDTHGHAEGDAVLVRLSEALTESVRRTDICCRLGGEEFAVIFPDCEPKEAAEVMRRVARHLRSGDAPGRSTTFSCGIADGHTGTAEDLFKRADRCTYEAKLGGKNRIVLAPAARGEHATPQRKEAA